MPNYLPVLQFEAIKEIRDILKRMQDVPLIPENNCPDKDNCTAMPYVYVPKETVKMRQYLLRENRWSTGVRYFIDDDKIDENTIHVFEIQKGSRVVSREDLVRFWNTQIAGWDMEDLLKELGFDNE